MKQVFKILAVTILITAVAGCAEFSGSRRPKYPTPLNDQMKESFSLAEQSYNGGNFTEAGRLYQTYISAYGYNELTDEARFKLGEIAFMNKSYNAALSYYREAFQNLYNPGIAPKAQFKAAACTYNLNQFGEALSLLNTMERRDLSSILALRVDSLAVRTGKHVGSKRDELIKWYLFLLDDYGAATPQEYEGKVPAGQLVPRETAAQAVNDWVRDANVSLAQVDSLPLADMKGKPSGGFLLYKLAMVNYANGNFDETQKFMKKFLRDYPKHDYAGQGGMLLAELKGKTSGKKYKIGVILPLSGRFSLYGNSTLHGIQCAAGLTPPCTSPINIELVVKDSAGSAAQAGQAVIELAKEGVVGIVGPLLSSTVDVAIRQAQELQVPIISLSQKDDIAVRGNFIFKHALTVRDQIDTLVNYTIGEKKLKKLGILYPQNNYGSSFARLFRQSVEAAGGKVIFEDGYSHQDLKKSELAKEMGSYTTLGGSPAVDGFSKRFEVPKDVQAVFIPDSYKAVRYVVLAAHNDSPEMSPGVIFLGVDRWNNPGLVSHDMGLLEGSVFIAGFYKDSADVTTRSFVQSFLSAFGMEPTILEAQAYDALKIMMAGISDGGTSRSKLALALPRVKNVGGATGTISIGQDGESRRKLFILTVKNGSIAELSSARGPVKGMGFSYSKTSKDQSDEKYGGRKATDLTVRGTLPKYESDDFYDKELE